MNRVLQLDAETGAGRLRVRKRHHHSLTVELRLSRPPDGALSFGFDKIERPVAHYEPAGRRRSAGAGEPTFLPPSVHGALQSGALTTTLLVWSKETGQTPSATFDWLYPYSFVMLAFAYGAALLLCFSSVQVGYGRRLTDLFASAGLMALSNYGNHGSAQGCTTINRDHIDSVLEAYRMYADAAGYPQRDY